VLRSTNFRGDGQLDFSDVAEMEVETRHFDQRHLVDGDIIIERSGGGPKQPVGRAAIFDPPDDRRYCTSNFTSALRIVDRDLFDPRFVALYLHALYLTGATEQLQRATTGIRNLDWQEYLRFEVPMLPVSEQETVAGVIGGVRSAYRTEDARLTSLMDLKRAAMQALFTRGLRGEAQKETEIGPVPESWTTARLDQYAVVVSTRMTYSELENTESVSIGDTVRVHGIKVADMNILGNEIELKTAFQMRSVPRAIALSRCAPPRTIIFPKRGAAIATNKKRISCEWTAFDPNVIGVISGEDLDQGFLFHWFQGFDLKSITEPGPTPQLNKKDLIPLIIPVPPTLDEQQDIAALLSVLDRKIDLHRRKRAVLDQLFRALLHQLMTGALRVADLDLTALSPQAKAEVAA
jgi:type I restriction enzyme S subunit